ncbi:hypothetical protein CSOJ01_08154 [Colletotrichum sojae]|uniref:Uncharacterized protein n=1 Tax=Colletotrichum sojae TaxID=2175907 RepID=A0A8H6J7M0_9PEZI|nr:hypothetical protein CSOJ01_08154 [Colletotrichum sojae]
METRTNGNRSIIAEIRDDVVVVVSSCRRRPHFDGSTSMLTAEGANALGPFHLEILRAVGHLNRGLPPAESPGTARLAPRFPLDTRLVLAFCTAPALHLQPVALQRTENLTILGLLSPITRLRAVADKPTLLAVFQTTRPPIRCVLQLLRGEEMQRTERALLCGFPCPSFLAGSDDETTTTGSHVSDSEAASSVFRRERTLGRNVRPRPSLD